MKRLNCHKTRYVCKITPSLFVHLGTNQDAQFPLEEWSSSIISVLMKLNERFHH